MNLSAQVTLSHLGAKSLQSFSLLLRKSRPHIHRAALDHRIQHAAQFHREILLQDNPRVRFEDHGSPVGHDGGVREQFAAGMVGGGGEGEVRQGEVGNADRGAEARLGAIGSVATNIVGGDGHVDRRVVGEIAGRVVGRHVAGVEVAEDIVAAGGAARSRGQVSAEATSTLVVPLAGLFKLVQAGGFGQFVLFHKVVDLLEEGPVFPLVVVNDDLCG